MHLFSIKHMLGLTKKDSVKSLSKIKDRLIYFVCFFFLHFTEISEEHSKLLSDLIMNKNLS